MTRRLLAGASLLGVVLVCVFLSRRPASVAASGSSVTAPTLAAATDAPAAATELLPTEANPAPRPSARPDFATITTFRQWADQFVQAAPAERAALAAEGRTLAAARRPEMKKLIVADPERALELAIPRVIRQQLPAEIVSELEKPVSARGDYNVYLGKPQPGVELPAEMELALRYFETQAGDSYRAHVFGPRLPLLSKKDVPLQGVAIDRELAVATSPVRPLEVGEIIPPGTTVEETCPVSGEVTPIPAPEAPVEEDQPILEVEGRLILLCNGTHVRVVDESYRQASGLEASGGPGGAQIIKDAFPGTSSEAIGNFRALYIRVTYPDQNRAPNTEAMAYADMTNVQRYFLENSFGRLSTTTVVTPLVMLPHTKEWYIAKDEEIDGLGRVHSDARSEARRLGYDSGQFNVTIVRVNGGPRLSGVSWGGGDSVWVSWDGMDVINHEAGHSLGRNHANFWNTGGESAIGEGGNAEYGNKFDVMGGGGGFGAHYNTVGKRSLGWLNDANLFLPQESGTYRIFAYDQPRLEEDKRYGIRMAKDARRTYHVEYHANASTTELKNSALVIWNWSDLGNNGHLIDTTPGTPGGKNDGGIEVGRTFSDTVAGLHFTVVGKDDTTVPPSLDVTVNKGAFPGNHPPQVTLTATATSVAVGGELTFTATASDPDGDALAWHWDCGDGTPNVNSPTLTRTFPTARQHTVLLTVSDMKGGVTRKHVVVTVGSPGRSVVSGRITAAGNALPGVLVSNGTVWAYTDENGDYALSNLSSGSTTLTAKLYGWTFTPGFSNPITVGAGANAPWTAVARPEVTISAGPAAVEGGANGSFTLTRTGSTTAAMTVRVLSAGGSAARGTDYNFNPAYVDDGDYRTFTIPAGAASLAISVVPVNDSSKEGPETITLQLAEGADYLVGGNAVATLALEDDDTTQPKVSLASSDPTAAEGVKTAAFTLTRTGSTATALTVNLAYSGTATAGPDYTPLPASVSIPAGQSTATLTLTPVQDTAVEGRETAVVTVSTNASYVVDPNATSTTLTIIDDDVPTLSVTAIDASASETGRDPGVFLVTRTGSTAAPLTVYYGLAGSALHGTDYIALPAEITIPAGVESVPVFVTPYDDAHGEPDETVDLRLTVFNGSYLVGEASTARVTIHDGGDPPLVTVSGFSSTVGEPNDTGSFRFTATGSVAVPITLRYTVSGTATPGVDYTALSGIVTIPGNGDNSVDVTVTPLDDALAEDMETIVVTLTPDPAYIFYNDASGIVWLRDDDAPTVNVTAHRDAPTEAGAASSFYIGRTDATGDPVSSGALTVHYTVGGTATNGVDYDLLGGTAVIPDGESGVDVVVTPVNDTLVEGTETITLTLAASSSYSRGASVDTLYLTDNETLPSTVGFEVTTSTTTEAPEPGNGVYRTVNVTLSPAAAAPVTVEYFVSSGTVALADGIDWSLVDPTAGNADIRLGQLTFAPGVNAQTVKFRVVDDGVVEGSEAIVLELRYANGARISTSRTKHTVTLQDNAAANPAVRVGFFAATSSQAEDGPSAPLLMAALDQPATAPLTVNYAVSSGPATAGNDFTLPAGTLTFAPGETALLVPLALVNDTDVEPDETVTITLSAPTGGALGSLTSHTLTIVDDDTPVIEVTAPDTPATEPAGAAAFTLTRTGGRADVAATVSFTLGGTATPGVDYTALPTSLTLAAGEMSRTLVVTPLDDAATEPQETVTLTLGSGAGWRAGAAKVATILLADDDVAPVITLLAPASLSVAIPTGVALALEATAERVLPAGNTPATVAWTKVSGAGTVTFENAAAASTFATFSAAGPYVLRLTATLGTTVSTQEVSVLVGISPAVKAATATDVGNTEVAGRSTEMGGSYTLVAAGSGLSSSGTSDGFHFLAAPVSGNFDVRVRVVSKLNPGGDNSCRLGLMARASLAPDALYAATFYRGDGSHSWQYRTTTGAAPGSSSGSTAYTLPRWLRLVRSGNTFTAYHSADGSSWSQRGSAQTVALPAEALLGLALTSAETDTASTAVFDQLTVPLATHIGPLVDAGPSLSGASPLALAGTASDDSGVAPLVSWHRVSGPGNVLFSNGNSLSTGADFSAGGSYVLRLTADDGAVRTADTTTATATVTTPPIVAWRGVHFSDNPALGADLADPDGDGVDNLLEYAANTLPRSASSAAGLSVEPAGGSFAFTYRRNLAATDVTFALEGSDTLQTWTPLAGTETTVSDDGQTRVVRVTIPLEAVRRFVRLRITH